MTMITPSYLGETIEYSSLHACRSTLEDPTSRLLYQHTVRNHNPRDLELYAMLRPGEDSIHALERHERGDLMRYRRDVFDDKYARLRGDRPCKTIVAHLAKDGYRKSLPYVIRKLIASSIFMRPRAGQGRGIVERAEGVPAAGGCSSVGFRCGRRTALGRGRRMAVPSRCGPCAHGRTREHWSPV